MLYGERKKTYVPLNQVVGNRSTCFTNPIRRQKKKIRQAHEQAAALFDNEEEAKAFVRNSWESMPG